MDSPGGISRSSVVNGERGALAALHVVVIAVVLVAAAVAALLLANAWQAAQSIDAKAERIAAAGRGINIATDSVIQLQRTNETANSILESARPLEGKLATIIKLARGIDRVAGSIDTTAGAINSTAERINSTAERINSIARGIDAQAVQILDVAQLIDRDARLINTHLNVTIQISRAIERDTSSIVGQARAAHQTTACIDGKLTGRFDGHCRD